jgi:hypothetical protein
MLYLLAPKSLVYFRYFGKTSDSENGYRDFDITYTFRRALQENHSLLSIATIHYRFNFRVTTLNGRLLLYENGN